MNPNFQLVADAGPFWLLPNQAQDNANLARIERFAHPMGPLFGPQFDQIWNIEQIDRQEFAERLAQTRARMHELEDLPLNSPEVRVLIDDHHNRSLVLEANDFVRIVNNDYMERYHNILEVHDTYLNHLNELTLITVPLRQICRMSRTHVLLPTDALCVQYRQQLANIIRRIDRWEMEWNHIWRTSEDLIAEYAELIDILDDEDRENATPFGQLGIQNALNIEKAQHLPPPPHHWFQ